jgi:hypothetical protein
MERARPVVFVLTDGSGRGHVSRLPATTRVLQRAGATRGAIYGRFTDAAVYRALLSGDIATFVTTAADLAAALLDEGIDHLVADAAEGYNPSHDVCRYLVNAAVEIAARSRVRGIANYEFDLVTRPAAPGESGTDAADGTAVMTLDDDALARKLEAARGYIEMAAEVDAALAACCPSAFRLETLRAVAARDCWRDPAELPPVYERHGERRLADGAYADVIRFTDHVRPLRDALRACAGAVPA